MATPRPGSAGEHALQERYGEFKRAAAFYDKQMLDHLNPLMREYVARQEMAFIATADAHGECDVSFRAGPRGFVRVIDDRTVMYPEYRGNGVMASMGNISENGHVGILFVDFFHSAVGLHINGRARIVEADVVEAFESVLARAAGVDRLHPEVSDRKKTPQRWVVVDVVEAYIHCSKHIPLLRPLEDGDADSRSSGDYFRVKNEPRPWLEQQAGGAQETERVVSPEQPEHAPVEAAAVTSPVSLEVDEPGCGLDAEQAPAVADSPAEAGEPVADPGPDAEPGAAPVPERAREAPVAGPEIALDDDEVDTTDDDELEFLVPPPWGAYRS